MKAFLIGLAALASNSTALPAAAAEQPKIIGMVHYSSSNARSKLMGLIAKGNALDRKFGCGCTIRVWEEVFGGDGGVTLTIEFKSLLAMAQYQERVREAPEWAEWGKEMEAAGIKPTNILLQEVAVP